MKQYIINGGNRIDGVIKLQGAKNSVLPILAATVMCEGECVIENCPDIVDVEITLQILEHLGCVTERNNDVLRIDATNIKNNFIPLSLMQKMRSSVIFLGAIIARMKSAQCSYPGGCELGARPINLHLKAFKTLGIEAVEDGGYINCDGRNFKSANVHLDFPSVGATENVMLASCLGKGTTRITNAAREPEIVELQDFLNKCGAKIKGGGSSTIVISAVNKLSAVQYKIMPDRIVAGTYMCAVGAVGGELLITNVNNRHISGIVSVLRESNMLLHEGNDEIYIKQLQRPKSIDIVETLPYPAYPTDAQSQLLAMLSIANGTSIIKENIFENRYKIVSEIKKMGADITVMDRIAIIKGVNKLNGAPMLKCPDLRGGAALCIAALCAEGESNIYDIHHIERGYERFDENLRSIGVNIRKIGD